MLSKFGCNRAKPFFGVADPGWRKMRRDLLACYWDLKKRFETGRTCVSRQSYFHAKKEQPI